MALETMHAPALVLQPSTAVPTAETPAIPLSPRSTLYNSSAPQGSQSGGGPEGAGDESPACAFGCIELQLIVVMCPCQMNACCL